MIYEQLIGLDINRRNTYVYAKQADNKGRVLRVKLMDGNKIITIPSGATVTLRAEKPDGTYVVNNGSRNSDGTASIALTDQVLAVEGLVNADINVVVNGESVSSATFGIKVGKMPSGSAVTSSNEFLTLEKLIEEATAVTQNVVSTSAQTLTEAQKAQARANIGITEYDDTSVQGEIRQLKNDLVDLENSLLDKDEKKYHDASESYIYSNSLNTEYVWVITKNKLPKGYAPTIKFLSENGGNLKLLFFSKNDDGTYALRHTEDIVAKDGWNNYHIEDISDISIYDTYIGFYSNDGAIKYNSSGARGEDTTRCLFSSVSSRTTMSGSFALDISYEITATYRKLKPDKKFILVDANGNGNYTSVYDAIMNEEENTPIYINSGMYEINMSECLRKRIILIGTDRNSCILYSNDGRYGHHPLYVSCGYFENLTIESNYVSGISNEIGATELGAYAVHIDTDEDYAVGKTTEFHHCILKSDFFPAIGVGLRKDSHLILDDCWIENNQIEGRGKYSSSASWETAGTLGAVYLHDSNGIQGNQYFTMKDCVLKSKLGNALCLFKAKGGNNIVYCNLIRNTLKDEKNGFVNNIFYREDPFGSDGNFVKLVCYGNSNTTLDN